MSNSYQTAAQIRSSIERGDITVESVVREQITRIESIDPKINAIVIKTFERALTRAKSFDQNKGSYGTLPPLFGVPVTIKESFNLAGTKSTINFPPLKNNVAKEDSIFVTRLEQAGAIILGKTNVPTMLADSQTFGPIYPTCNNPYDLTRTPGGSTGGGGAAMAAGFACLEIGSDIGGSIRNPSHYCGLYGLKPSQNGHKQDGHIPPMPNSNMGFMALNSTGPLARTMSDLRLAYDTCYTPRPEYRRFLTTTSSREVKTLKGLKFGYYEHLLHVEAGKDVRSGMKKLINSLVEQGAEVKEIKLDDQYMNRVIKVWAKLFGFVAGQDFNWMIRLLMKFKFGMDTRASRLDIGAPLNEGLSLDFKAYSQALYEQQELIAEFYKHFDDFDFILSPTSPGPAFEHNHKHKAIELDGQRIPYAEYCFAFVAVYNALELPVLAVPTGLSQQEGLPIGISIAAPHFQEQSLLDLGDLIEQQGFHFTPPEL